MAGHDVFISYSSKDQLAANAVCHGLEARSIKCWMAPRDQMAGKPYGEQITEAIQSAKVMVLVFSDNVNASRAVHNEVDLAAGANVTIVPFRITGAVFNSELRFYLGRVHWLDAFPQPVENYIDGLADTVRRNLVTPEPEFTGEKPPPLSTDGPAPDQIRPRPAPEPLMPGPPTPLRPKPAAGSNTQLFLILGGLGGLLLLSLILMMTVLPGIVGGSDADPNKINQYANIANGQLNAANVAGNTGQTGDVPPPGPQRVAYYENLTVQNGPPAQIAGIRRVDTRDMAQIVGNRQAVIFDARGCTHTDAVIPSSICDVASFRQQYGLETPVVFYCADGACAISANLANSARSAGYTNVYWYRGGIHAWVAAGLQTTTWAQIQQQQPAQAPQPQLDPGQQPPDMGGDGAPQ